MRLSICFLSVLFFGCATIQKGQWSEQELYGVWVINHSPENVDYSIIEYSSNDDKCEMSYEVTPYGLKVILYWSKWRLENGIITTTMHATTGAIPLGYVINDKILELNPNKLNVIINDPGEWNSEYHMKNVHARDGQVCNIVQRALGPNKE